MFCRIGCGCLQGDLQTCESAQAVQLGC
uniref:Uncharacterized protein n=1 Tax=Anguilla anguilla TaxID=7936 RepID=A0A0E9UTW9_ANGAN